MLWQAGVLLLFLVSTHALSRLRPLDGIVEHVQIDQILTAHDRVQRSVEEMCEFPHLLRFQFDVNGTVITFNLQKNDRFKPNVPIYVTKNGKLKKEKMAETNNFALYQDLNRGSAMLVTCEEDGSYKLHGSFYHNGQRYHMSPANVPELAQTHFIQRHDSNNKKFLNDFVNVPLDVKNKNKQFGGASQTRKKRQTVSTNIVEILVSTDVSIYDYFLADQGTDVLADAAIQQYVSLLINEIDLHFISVGMTDSSINIRCYLAGVIIAKSAAEASWSTNSQTVTDGLINGVVVNKAYLNINDILDNVRTWRSSQSNFPQHDHMMALSMVDLADFADSPVTTSVEGVAYLGAACASEYQVSFTEVDGSRTSLTAAHELGHGLGALHDGQTSCDPNSKNIMVASSGVTTTQTYAQAQWTFSSCSVAAFKTYIDSLGSNCLQKQADDYVPVPEAPQLPGEVYSLDQQCQLYDSTSSCSSTISEADCYTGYHCATDSGCSGIYYPLYPLAGTPCGTPSDNKWCYRGLCVARTVIATTTTTDPTTSTTPTTTSSTLSTTTSTIPETTTSTTSSTTSTTQSTTTTTSSTTSTTPTTTSTTSSTTSTTPPTTSTTSSTTTSTTPETTTSTSSSTTSTTQPTTSTTSCRTSTTPLTSSTSSTTSTTSATPCYSGRCCVRFGWFGRAWKVCCKGKSCCRYYWTKNTVCCRTCSDRMAT